MRPSASFAAALVLLAGQSAAKEIKVKAGQKIQIAINSASPGDKITVEKGTYAEQLRIVKNNIRLVGEPGSTLVSPPQPLINTNECSGLVTSLFGFDSQAGICVFGNGAVLGDLHEGDLGHKRVTSVTGGGYVDDVQISGLAVSNFSGVGIAVVAGRRTSVIDNVVFDNPIYSILSVGSTATTIARNKAGASSTLFRDVFGIGIDDTGAASLKDNTVQGCVFGVEVMTSGTDVTSTTVSRSCFGIVAKEGVSGVHITHNTVTASDPSCADTVSNGIGLWGASDSVISHNTVSGQSGSQVQVYGPAAGIAVFDLVGFPARGNTVEHNTLSGNDLDIELTAGATVSHNKCSTPPDLCSK